MFFMGEEVGTPNPFIIDTFSVNKVDFAGQRAGDGRFLFRFYQDLIRFVTRQSSGAFQLDRRDLQSQRQPGDRIHPHSPETESAGGRKPERYAFVSGYVIATDASRLPAGGWQEVFNSDATVYGGANIGNRGAVLSATSGQVNTVIPAHGFIVLAKVS